MPWSEEEDQEQTRLQQGVEAMLKRGPTGPLPPFEEVVRMRVNAGLKPLSRAQYDEEVERRDRARSAS